MVETDWKEILSLSQKELKEADKEQLCESLSWMDADDIELNFADLKTLFRLTQDILKFKSEQVNNLLGQLEKPQKKRKGKAKGSPQSESPQATSDLAKDIERQEEMIKSNKEILAALYADIAELEETKIRLQDERHDMDSESSRSVLSELNAVKELQSEITSKNRHLKKLISDIKSIENENVKLKEKTSLLKEKLNEATQLIENLTEKLYSVNKENSQLKEVLGKNEKIKSTLNLEIDTLKKELLEKDSAQENVYEDVKAKVQYWKNLARTTKTEVDNLNAENVKLKDALKQTPKSSPKKNIEETIKLHELQDKLSQATNEMLESATLIEKLKNDNIKLRLAIEDAADQSTSDARNESDEKKERALINKLKKKVNNLTVANQGLEEMIVEREQQLTEIAAQLQQLQTNEGIKQLLDNLKVKKRQLKSKDQGIKTLVQEINTLRQDVDDFQLENETLRQKLNIPVDKKIAPKGILKKYYDMEKDLAKLHKKIEENENKVVELELDNLELASKVTKLTNFLSDFDLDQDQIDRIFTENNLIKSNQKSEPKVDFAKHKEQKEELKAVIEENAGLRKSLKELLNFLKDNSTTTSGVLSLECPSLDSVLQSMEARSSAGWYAPHMSTVMELRTAIGGRDALLTALHQARKETFDVMQQLSKESSKCTELEQKLKDIEEKQLQQDKKETEEIENISLGEFGSWMLNTEDDKETELNDSFQVDRFIQKRNTGYEEQLKTNLLYFHNKYKYLFDKMTLMAVQAADDQNKWSILEEKYKATIENLKSRIQDDEEASEVSPGIISMPSPTNLQRKCVYLEESYKHFRTMSENNKNECMELKKEMLLASANHEDDIQKLMFVINRLNDKLRNSIPIDICKKQSIELSNVILKYRKYLEDTKRFQNTEIDLQKIFEDNKADIISSILKSITSDTAQDISKVKDLLSEVELSVLQKQIQQLCHQLEDKNNEVQLVITKNSELQAQQSKLIDETLFSETAKEVNYMKSDILKLNEENKILKEQTHHTQNQLNVALIQLQDKEQKHMNHEIEINMLRHQILDLQSTGDNKAIIARLSNEVLVTHLQVTENYNKIERLNMALNKEKQMRIEAEQMLQTREKVFDVYSSRFESKFKYLHEIMQALRQQYQGCLPLFSIENYLNSVEEYTRKSQSADHKLSEIEDLRSELITKHSVYNHILDISKNECMEEENNCSHKLQIIVMQNTHIREVNHLNKKIQTMEKSREEMLKYCNYLEKTLVLVNQGFSKSIAGGVFIGKDDIVYDNNSPKLDLEDVQSDDDTDSRKSKTITLPKPQVKNQFKPGLKPGKNNVDVKVSSEENALLGSPIIHSEETKVEPVNITTQTSPQKSIMNTKLVQTDADQEINILNVRVKSLVRDNENYTSELTEARNQIEKLQQQSTITKQDKFKLEQVILDLKTTIDQKDLAYEKLSGSLDILKSQIDDIQGMQLKEKQKSRHTSQDESNSLLVALKQAERDKENIITEYKILLQNERQDYKQSVKEMQMKIQELQSNLDKKSVDSSSNNSGLVSSLTSKYSWKIAELEDKCFKLQSELDVSATELRSCQSEMERWKNLASDRLVKMESLNTQLEDRHSQEVDSYKAENQHWVVQLNECQREQLEMRTRFSEQRTVHMKQLQEKDAQMEQLRSLVHGLKTQILNMQTLLSTSEPSFDLSAIVEVEEPSDESQYGSERLEIKFDSSGDLNQIQNGVAKLQASSTAIWQEPIIERLRREKQLASKQNSLLRRQIKALAARERRARLDSQNLKNQLFRITSGKKVVSAESGALLGRVATLQAELAAARRDAELAAWDKRKRAQQSSDRWQARYEDKCQEVNKLESSLNLAKTAVIRLQREKRVLMNRVSELTNQLEDNVTRPSHTEKQDGERSEKYVEKYRCEECARAPVSSAALLERVEAQQRRIAALEVAERGNEVLVSEYEKCLAEVTSLKGQVLKLESTVLEAQILTPITNKDSAQPELEYWKSYCEMLKEENVQLNVRVSTLESQHSGGSSHRVNDLEQTVLTLRGLVSKLHSEQKPGVKRVDSTPSSGRSGIEKGRSQLESYRIEIANLKRSMQDKDLLLERSKEMLKIAADREDELLRENMLLRRRLEEQTDDETHGFLSV